MKKLLYIFIIILQSAIPSMAQEGFTEGILEYAVYIRNPIDESTVKTGSYTFTIKNDYFKKELELKSGFGNTIIQTPVHTYSIRKASGDGYFAIELSDYDIRKQNAAFEKYAIVDLPGTKTLAGWKGQKAQIQYSRDTANAILYYNKNLQIDTAVVFDRFTHTKYIPLIIEYTNMNGLTLIFRLEKIKAQPIDNTTFLLPENCRIITRDEYREMMK